MGGMAQAVECLLSNPKALSSNPIVPKKKKRKEKSNRPWAIAERRTFEYQSGQ
jgi:hypothetical protein